MHYTINYADLSPADKQRKALADIQEYMGQERFEKCTEELKKATVTLEQFEMLASFAGIQGYPVRAWFEHCYGRPS